MMVKRVGIVDMGSGSSRLAVYNCQGRFFYLADEIKEATRLGEGLAKQNKLTDAAMYRSLSALKGYADYAKANVLDEFKIVATSAARDAANGHQFLEQVAELGLEVQLLSGEQEAAMGVCAVAHSFNVQDAWVMDLGGGSAQVSWMEGGEYQFGHAYPLGTVRMTEQFFGPHIKKGEVQQAVQHIKMHLEGIAESIKQRKAPLIAMGGTIRNLAKIVQRQQNYPVDWTHGYFLSSKDLIALSDQMLKLPLEKRRQLPGLQHDRADIIAAGALVYATLVKMTNIDGIWISGQGVREGVLYQSLFPQRPESIRGYWIGNLLQRYPQHPEHLQRMQGFVAELFDALAPHQPDLEPNHLELLKWSVQVHDIGMHIGFYDHHRHGEYLIESAAIPGFTHEEQACLASLVRNHRKGEIKFKYKGLIQPKQAAVLPKLCIVLRMAEAIERSRSSRVRNIKAAVKGSVLSVAVECTEEPWVEISELNKHASSIAELFKLQLDIAWRNS